MGEHHRCECLPVIVRCLIGKPFELGTVGFAEINCIEVPNHDVSFLRRRLPRLVFFGSMATSRPWALASSLILAMASRLRLFSRSVSNACALPIRSCSV